LLKKSIHFAFTASISAFWANAGKISPTTKAIARGLRVKSLCELLHTRIGTLARSWI
jgi:hypothetical protein